MQIKIYEVLVYSLKLDSTMEMLKNPYYSYQKCLYFQQMLMCRYESIWEIAKVAQESFVILFIEFGVWYSNCFWYHFSFLYTRLSFIHMPCEMEKETLKESHNLMYSFLWHHIAGDRNPRWKTIVYLAELNMRTVIQHCRE